MRKILFYSLLAVLVACEGPEGPEGPAGPAGPNGNNGTSGLNSLIALSEEAAGDNCANGGTRIDAGIDDNGDGQLGSTEVDQTEYVCNGSSSGGGPKELRFALGSLSGSFESPTEQTVYEGFDIANYEAYDSIVIVFKAVAVFEEQISSPSDVAEAFIDVINITDDNAIVDGSHTIVKTGDVFVSPNLASSLPTGRFDLGLKITAEENFTVVMHQSQLILVNRH